MSLRDLFSKHPWIKKSVLLAARVVGTLVAGPGVGEAAERVLRGVLPEAPPEGPESLVEELVRRASSNPEVASKLETALRMVIKHVVLGESVAEIISQDLSPPGGPPGAPPPDPEFAQEVKNAVAQVGYGADSELAKRLDSLSGRIEELLGPISQRLADLERLVSYYQIPSGPDAVLDCWGLPKKIEQITVLEERREEVVSRAIKLLESGQNVVIVGEPGVGKTTLLYEVWRRLWPTRNLALLREGAPVRRLHEERGYILFFDDLPEAPELARAVARAGAKYVVATGRTADWEAMDPDVKRCFARVEVPAMDDETVGVALKRHLSVWGISSTPEAEAEVVKKAGGLPIYVWMVVRELVASGRSELTLDFAKSIPSGMREYVSDVLGSVFFERGFPRRGAATTLLTAVCITDMRGYRIHADHLEELYRRVSSMAGRLGDEPDPSLFVALRGYLARDPETRTYRLPHDTWADVLRGGAVGPLAGLVDAVLGSVGKVERLSLLRESSEAAWERVLRDFRVDPEMETDRILSLAYLHLLNGFGRLPGLEEVLEACPWHKTAVLIREMLQREEAERAAVVLDLLREYASRLSAVEGALRSGRSVDVESLRRSLAHAERAVKLLRSGRVEEARGEALKALEEVS